VSAVRSPLTHLAPSWYAAVMGLKGLSLVWQNDAPVLVDGANAGALVVGAAAALMFAALW
jgi:tellurite resistance protein TehA-like permease